MKIGTFIILALLASLTSKGQKNFSYQPSHPRPGDVITFTYSPAGDLVNVKNSIEAKYYLYGWAGYVTFKAEDLPLMLSGTKYTGTISTDTSSNFVQIGFYFGDTYDNNFNEGYTIPMWKGDSICKETYSSLSIFYRLYCTKTGVEANMEKALSILDKQRSLYPDQKVGDNWDYNYILKKIRKDQLQGIILKEIESAMRRGLKSEDDYSRIHDLYKDASLFEQAAFIENLKHEKFPDGDWKVRAAIQQLNFEIDSDKCLADIKSIHDKMETDSVWKKRKRAFLDRTIQLYARFKMWGQLKPMETDQKNQAVLAETYNDLAWEMQEKSEDLKKAEEISSWATESTKKKLTDPVATKPDEKTVKEWKKQLETTYAQYADTYAMVEYKMGKYDHGFPYTDEAAVTINKGQDADQNNTWALLAEKVLSSDKCRAQLEQFVRDAKATDSVKAVLRRVYILENKSTAGFDEYISALEKEEQIKLEAEIRKNMISQEAPVFILKNLQGKEVDLAKLKGKVVVIDFWATWCGPCMASLPGMQKEVNKFKDNHDVQFLFIDTWENGELDAKHKNANDFISKNKYTFNVLMDNDNKAIGKYKVDGIPTKFVIDKNGMIRFKTVGFENELKLKHEVDTMIGICLKP